MSTPPPSSRVGLGALGGYDEEIYGQAESTVTSISAHDLEDDDDSGAAAAYKSRYLLAQQGRRDREAATVFEDEKTAESADPFAAYRKSRVSDRENDYKARRLQRALSPTRVDAFVPAAAADGAGGDGGRTYRDVMADRRLSQEEAAVLRSIERKRREEADSKRLADGRQRQDEMKDEAQQQQASQAGRKRRRWDDEADEQEAAAAKKRGLQADERKEEGGGRADEQRAAPLTSIKTDEDDNEPLDWDTTSLLKQKTLLAASTAAAEMEERAVDAGSGASPAWDATPKRKSSRWDATPVADSSAQQAMWDATPKLTAADATPLMGATPGGRKRSRWDETPLVNSSSTLATPGPAGSATPSLASLTPSQLAAYRVQADIDARNRPLTDEELNAMLPGPADGFEILTAPESYRPIRTPARKLMLTPTPAGADGFFMPTEALSSSLLEQIPALPADSGLPAFNKPEDQKYFAPLLQDVDESTLSAAEQRDRRIMKLLLKIKNGTPPQRKTALRTITDRAREFGAGPLFDAILPLLMSPTLEDGERHVLVKVIDRVLYRLDELVRPYVHKLLVVIEPLLIDEDYFARVEGREIISNLAKAAGLATMIAVMRPDIDNTDEYVRNTTARAFAVVASALGIHSMLPFLQAVCQSRRSWEARHTGIKVVQQIAILMGLAVLPHLTAMVGIIGQGLQDEQTKVKCITALALAALAEASHPYGIESFDSVLKPLWLGVKGQRGKTLAAFLKAIGFIIPLMEDAYASYYTREVMPILIREFATPDEEMKKIVLKVVKQCVATLAVDAEYVRTQLLPDFFRHFWVRRMALDRRNHRELVETTVELSAKVGCREIVSRIVADLKDESELYRKMVMDCIEKVVAAQGVADVDVKLEEALVDGLLFAFQEQQSDDAAVAAQLMTSFGVIVNALGQRCKPYLPQVAGIIKWRLNNKQARVRQQAAELISRIASVMKACGEEAVLQHLGTVLYEYLGEEYPDVLGAIVGALKAVVNALGVEAMQPPIKDLLPRLTPILKNRHETVQQQTIDLVGRIADKGAEHVNHKEWMRICFELLEMLKAPRHSIRRAAVNTFGYIAKAIGPHDVLSTLLNNLRVQERQMRVCCCVAIAIVAETCSPFTVLPALLNEFTVPELNVQNGVLKALSFLFEYIGPMAKDYVYATIPLLQDALMDRDAVHRQTACTVVKHLSLGCAGLGREDCFLHLLNYVWPNVFETSPHVINAVMEAVEGCRLALGSARLLQYLMQGLWHPARKVRNVYWRMYNSMYVACVDSLVAAYPRLPNDDNNDYRRYELEVFV